MIHIEERCGLSAACFYSQLEPNRRVLQLAAARCLGDKPVYVLHDLDLGH